MKSSNPSRIVTVAADLTDEKSLINVTRHIDSYTKIKFVINCAATAEPFSSLTRVSIPALRSNLELNTIAPIALMQHLAPYFVKDATRFLFIGSCYVDVRTTFDPDLAGAYAMGKTAIRTGVEYLRHETEGNPVIGYLNPGATSTPMYDKFIHKMSEKGVAQQWNPTTPENIALFIKAVLENTSTDLYSKIDWDFENQKHHLQSGYCSTPIVSASKSKNWNTKVAVATAGIVALGVFAKIVCSSRSDKTVTASATFTP